MPPKQKPKVQRLALFSFNQCELGRTLTRPTCMKFIALEKG